MFDKTKTNRSALRLHDGAKVRLDVRGAKRPVHVADLCGLHYDIAGEMYDLAGNPVDPSAPAILEVLLH